MVDRERFYKFAERHPVLNGALGVVGSAAEYGRDIGLDTARFVKSVRHEIDVTRGELKEKREAREGRTLRSQRRD